MPVDVVDYCFAFDACHLSVTASARRTEAEGEVWAIFDVLCFGPPQFLGGANGWRGGTLPMATIANPFIPVAPISSGGQGTSLLISQAVAINS